MDSMLAIVVYGCAINGERTDSVDIQVRYFGSSDVAEVERRILAEPVHSYANDRSELVSWPILRIAAIEPLDSFSDGAEVIGFISDLSELGKGG
jgi:hypothetical protein